MRLLYPEAREGEPAELYRLDPRPGAPAGRPWVVVNMIATVDGAVAVEGRSGGLGGPVDRAVFHALRAAADVVLVGAGTVRAERYGPPKVPGLRIAVVSNRLELDWSWPLFGEGRPIVVTTRTSGPVPSGVDAVRAGDDRVDLPAALAALAERGARVVLCEGGPSLNGSLLEHDLLDEVCLTLSPMLAGGRGGRMALSAEAHLRRLQLVHAATADDGFLYLRYARPEGS